ncbi:hypothetical protein V501_08076 [Pseudogymnoascus sp. VKM F-4519 (FW-2642)]|nr:hypothetical protein V501_08076 [Pseudogymnoascus sp. VKM F-4519 (FW-2642)]
MSQPHNRIVNEMKIVVVTGASKSVGYEVVKALLQSDESYHVFLGGRSLERGQQAVLTLRNECADSLGPRDKGCALKECPNCFNIVEAIQVDISSDLSIEKAFETVKASVGRIDVLINNASVIKDLDYVRGKASLRESFTSSYDVNVAGTHVMTWTFMPLLLQSYDPRLIFVTGLDTFEESAREDFPLPLQERGWPKKVELETVGYRCTKTALNMLMLDYHHKLQMDGVKVWCVGPGFLATDASFLIIEWIWVFAGRPSPFPSRISSTAVQTTHADSILITLPSIPKPSEPSAPLRNRTRIQYSPVRTLLVTLATSTTRSPSAPASPLPPVRVSSSPKSSSAAPTISPRNAPRGNKPAVCPETRRPASAHPPHRPPAA